MSRWTLLFGVSLLLCGLTSAGCARRPPLPETIDPAEAMKDPDFKVQGEYVGEGAWSGDKDVKAGAQVVALSQGQFDLVVTRGGLPGEGWRRGDPRFSLKGKREGDSTALSGTDFSGKIADETLTVASSDGKTKLELKRVVRHSPTEGSKPPEGAKVLFDGTTADNFVHGTLSKDKNLMSEATTKQGFSDYTLHVEFRLSYMPSARGQERSNSGVYLHDCYEVQVLDSFGLEGEDNECGGFYKVRKPDVNMCFPPLTWQTYDVTFTAPKYKEGKKAADARVEVRQNGVLVQPEFALPHATLGRQGEGPAPRPFYLQGHGNKVEFRNIWVKEKE